MLSKGELQKPKGSGNDEKGLIKFWLRDNYIQYVNTLCSFLGHEEPGLQVSIFLSILYYLIYF